MRVLDLSTVPPARPDPLHLQVARILRRAIAEQDLVTDDVLPGENEIAAHMHVSPPVVRRALQELVSDGLITKRGGTATRITRRPGKWVDGRPGRRGEPGEADEGGPGQSVPGKPAHPFFQD